MGSILRAAQGEYHPKAAVGDGAGEEREGWR